MSGLLGGLAGCRGRLFEFGRDNDDQTPHLHGYLFITIDGTELAFTRSKYLIEHSDAVTATFHFHQHDEPNRWHMEGQRLVLAKALNALPDVTYHRANSAHLLRIDGQTYTEDDPNTEIKITERDRDIDPETYHLQDGDVIVIRITTGSDDYRDYL